LIFVDTSAWVALYVAQDDRHPEAAAFWERLRRHGAPLLSTFDIFGETLTVIRSRASLEQALDFGEAFLSSRILVREEVGPEVRSQAWELLKQYRDKPLSFTDCTSFAVLRRRGLRHVFSFDDDFRRLGFLVNEIPS
jgi:predicted nucleic acid-binding protein